MSGKVWVRHVLHGSFLLGTTVAVALWIGALTAKCEGFGCLGVGAIVGMAIMVQSLSAIIGGLLIWLQKTESKVRTWVLILETLHLLPVLWIIGRIALS